MGPLTPSDDVKRLSIIAPVVIPDDEQERLALIEKIAEEGELLYAEALRRFAEEWD